MFVLINDNNHIHKYVLNKSIKYKGIVFYQKEDSFYINLLDNLFFDDESKTKIVEEKEYIIKCIDFYYEIKVYVYDNDLGIDEYHLYKKCNFVIGDDNRAHIISSDPYLKDTYLYYKDNKIISNYDVIVNNKLYKDEYIKTNDVCEFQGIRIIFYEDYLYMNSFKIENKLNRYEPLLCRIKYLEEKIKPNYYLPCETFDLKIDKLEEFAELRKDNDGLIQMILPSLIMCVSTTIMALSNYYNNSDSKSILSYVVMPICMFLTGIILPIIFSIIEKNKNKRDYNEKKKVYLKYLQSYEDKIDNDIKNYIYYLNDHYFDLNSFKDKLFYAKNKTNDFLSISLGKTDIKKEFKYKKQNDEDINERLTQIKRKLERIQNVPLYLDLKKYKIVSIVSNNIGYFINIYLLELAYKHHYDDIKIALYKNNNKEDIYNLPHLFINNKRLTFFDEKRLSELDNMKLEVPLILFICDHTNYAFSNEMIHILYFSNSINDVYKDSDAIVEYEKNIGYLYGEKKEEFNYYENHFELNKYFNYLSKYNVIKKDNDFRFSNVFTNTIENNYLNHDSYLKAKFAYCDDEILDFDIHETKYGPHGLIAGTTGSGKSELIISFLLSLCINYPPDYLNIVLIDYKGGGILDSLSYGNKPIPHIIGSISNLEKYALERLIISLRNECYKREKLFKDLSNISKVSIMNYDDYLNNNLEEYGLEKIAHLLIVVDEFAELKKEHPEQISELISLSRIGRSLGLHLILATQKPSGVIDDEIWSNARFKLALKVFDENDSMDIIKSKDAAYLLNPGSFVMRVDGNLIKANSIYAKKDINDNDAYKISLLDECLDIDSTYVKQNNEIVSEASDYCRRIIEQCQKEKYKTSTLNHKKPTNKKREDFKSNNKLILGEIDDYLNNKVSILEYDLSDNLLIYSSRKKEINNILNTINESDYKCIVIGSDIYKGKNICDSLIYDDKENIEYLFNNILDNNINDFILVIEDLNVLLTYEDTYLEYLCKIIKRNNINNISITTSSNISFKIINSFNNKVLIEINDDVDIVSFFNNKSRYKSDSYALLNEPISIVPIILEDYKESVSEHRNILSYIPKIINAEVEENKILLGYELKTRRKIYATKDLCIVSNDESLLDIYKKAYKTHTSLYDYKLSVDTNNLLWLGEGIFSQRLFMVNLKDDLNYYEGIYIENGHKYVIRRIDA